jgi:hypothetical protein
MTVGYRSDVDARRFRRAWIASEIARLEPQVAALAPLSDELTALKRERDAIDEPFVETWASGVEWLVVGAVLLGLCLGAYAIWTGPLPRARVNQTRGDAQAIRNAALVYRDAHPRARCPTLAELQRDGTLDRSRRTVDAWGHPFRVTCDREDVAVISAGLDGRFGSDDIE